MIMSERHRRRCARGGGGGGGKPRWLAPSSSPLLLLLLLLLARAFGAAAETVFLTHAGLSSSAVVLDSPPRNAVDSDIASGISTLHFAATEQRYPWLAIDLGGPAKVDTVEVFGHKADAACHFHTRRDAGADRDAGAVQEHHVHAGADEAGGSLRTTTRKHNGRARMTYLQGWMFIQTRESSSRRGSQTVV